MSRLRRMTEEGRSHFSRPARGRTGANFVTLSSSSHAYAVSILPIGKMHDLQGGSSSSQKSRCAAIFGSPVFSAQSNGSLTFAPLSFRPRRHTPMLSAFCRLAKRSTCKATPPLPKNLASLRFSGALFNSPPSGEILRGALRQTNSFAVFGTAHRSIQDPSARSLAALAPSIGMTRAVFVFRDPSTRAGCARARSG